MNITIKDIESCRKLIAEYETKANEYNGKILTCNPSQRGAYASHRAQTLKSAKSIRFNLKSQLDWLEVHNRSLFEEVK